MLINDNPMSTVPARQNASRLVVSYQSKKPCPHCATYSSRRLRRRWLDRIWTFFTTEIPFFCSVCQSKYYAGFIAVTFDHASTGNAGLMSLQKALGPIRPITVNEPHRPAPVVHRRSAAGVVRPHGLQHGAGSH